MHLWRLDTLGRSQEDSIDLVISEEFQVKIAFTSRHATLWILIIILKSIP